MQPVFLCFDYQKGAFFIRHLANAITISRIAASLILFFTAPFSLSFYVLYSFCGASDIADGMVARKLGIQSRYGAALDSAADFIFLTASLIKLLPSLISVLPVWILWISSVIALLKITAYIIGACKFHRFAALHTILNKITGAMLFSIPYWTFWTHAGFLYRVICITACAAAAEELLIALFKTEPDPNCKSIFSLRP